MTTNFLKSLAALAFTVFYTRGIAQSSFIFQSPSPNDVLVLDANGVPLVGAEYVAVLYGGINMDSLRLARADYSGPSSMSPVPFVSIAPGFIAGPIVVVDSVFCGSSSWLQVRAWDTRVAPSYEAAVDLDIGGYGESSIFYADGACPRGMPGVPPPLFGLETFSLRPVVPEPSSWALLGLGSVGLYWVARRRGRSKS